MQRLSFYLDSSSKDHAAGANESQSQLASAATFAFDFAKTTFAHAGGAFSLTNLLPVAFGFTTNQVHAETKASRERKGRRARSYLRTFSNSLRRTLDSRVGVARLESVRETAIKRLSGRGVKVVRRGLTTALSTAALAIIRQLPLQPKSIATNATHF